MLPDLGRPGGVIRADLTDHGFRALGFRRGRCFAETDRMISCPVPLRGNATGAAAIAAFISASTSGRSSTAISGSLIERTFLPAPLRTFFGSGSLAPSRKQSATPLAWQASETIASDGRSVGP